MRSRESTRGFTMIELILALGLLSILVVALVQLLDTSLTIWNRTETGRDLQSMGASVLDLFAEDIYAIESGPRGDLVGEWVRFDIDRDGNPGAIWPRIRFVRQATAADLIRARPETTESGSRGTIDPRLHGLVEICWAILPPAQAEKDERPLGMLWRGERLVSDESLSFLDPRFFNAANKPTPGSLEVVTGGVLWMEVWYAAQTSILHDGWSIGDELDDCAASWDAFGRGRPSEEVSFLNAPARGMPDASELPLIPRRVRLTLEIERPQELKRRTRLSQTVDPDGTELFVDDEGRLPEVGRMILIDEEWMEVKVVGRGSVVVARAQRGTRKVVHEAGQLIHFGHSMTREIPLGVVREDWNL